MAEILKLSDDEKVEAMPDSILPGQLTEDKGICSQCGKEADADDFCFGCHKLICSECIEKEPHLSQC